MTNREILTQSWKEFLCWLIWHKHIYHDDQGEPIDGTFTAHCKRCGEHIQWHQL